MKPRTKTQPKSNVSTRVERETYQVLKQVAQSERRTVGQVARFAIEEYVERHQSECAA